MSTRHDTNNVRRKTMFFGLFAMVIYAIMNFFTLKEIHLLSGAVAFDMRPTGYSFEEAQLLLQGLGQAGRQYYLTYQIPLDVLFPALLVLFLTNAFLWCGSLVSIHKWVGIGVGFSWLACGADYVENAGITAMLLTWPDISANLVRATSMASVVKAGATTLAIILLLIIAARTVFHKRVSAARQTKT